MHPNCRRGTGGAGTSGTAVRGRGHCHTGVPGGAPFVLKPWPAMALEGGQLCAGGHLGLPIDPGSGGRSAGSCCKHLRGQKPTSCVWLAVRQDPCRTSKTEQEPASEGPSAISGPPLPHKRRDESLQNMENRAQPADAHSQLRLGGFAQRRRALRWSGMRTCRPTILCKSTQECKLRGLPSLCASSTCAISWWSRVLHPPLQVLASRDTHLSVALLGQIYRSDPQRGACALGRRDSTPPPRKMQVAPTPSNSAARTSFSTRSRKSCSGVF